MKFYHDNVFKAALCLSAALFLFSCGDDEDPVPQNPLSIADFSVTVDENPAAGQSLGTVMASSSDGGSFTYALSNEAPDGALAISNSGELTVNDATLFDFEENPTITAVVTIATGDFSESADVTILLEDVFEGTIWSGPSLTFTKDDGADPTAEANQDRLTANVWITRSNDGGQIFNAVTETTWDQTASPQGTAWAQGTTSEIANLDFQPFRAAVGQPKDVVGKALVMHLIEDDIYIDVQFTSWSQGRNGGFAYERSTPNQ